MEGIDWLSSSLLDEVASVTVIEEPFAKVRFWSVVLRKKIVFDVGYKNVGVARSHLGSH